MTAAPTPLQHRTKELIMNVAPQSPSIWHGVPSLVTANELSTKSLIGHLGIEFVDLGEDYLVARMPVDDRTRQPLGVLHGGASVALSESLASCAATFTVDAERASCVGMEINANHVRPVTSGWVTGVARPLALGRRTQVWEILITDDDDKLVCASRCTMAVIPKPTPTPTPTS
jgi:1,4-dihydroxy-2-naphthoyl-CoA hydrolase